MIKQAFLLHSIKFVSATIKEFSRFDGVDLYIMDNTKDFSYLIDDLRPEVLIIDPKSLNDKETQESFLKELNNAVFKKVEIVCLGNKAEIGNIDLEQIISYELPESIEPSKFFKKLQSLLNL